MGKSGILWEENMFRGLTSINLDVKGRLGMPVRYREHLQNEADGQVVVTIDTEESCLLLYPQPEWEIIERKIEALPSFNKTARRIQRLLIGHATELELDSQGRILIPALLRDYANMEKCTMLVGQGKKFELWSESNWQNERNAWLEKGTNSEGELPDELQSISL